MIKRNFTQDFLEIYSEIADYLLIEKIHLNFEFCLQDEDDTIIIPDTGKGFGTTKDANGNILVGNWLSKQSSRARKHLLNYFFIRESFKVYLENKFPKRHPYQKFFDIILECISIIYKMEKQKYRLTSAPIVTIRGRAEAFDEEEMIYQSQYWVFFLENSFKIKLSAKEIFHKAVEYSHNYLAENKTSHEIGLMFIRWMKTLMPSIDFKGTPKFIHTKRHFPIIKAIATQNHSQGSAEKIGNIVGRSYNTVNIAFKEIIEDYDLLWWTNLNYLELRLYPHLFRLTINDIKHKDMFIEKFKHNLYIRDLKSCVLDSELIVVGYMVCPLNVSRNLHEFFERLKKKNIIRSYFLKQIRNHRITYTISTKKFEPTIKTFQKLFNSTIHPDSHKIIALDESYDITSISTKTKKTAFDKDVLTFLSAIMARYIGKAHYMCRPLNLIYDLCEEKNLDSTNTTEVIDYVNQMEIRCRRLNLLNYYLYFRELVKLRTVLYVEIYTNNEILEKVIKKIENICEMITIRLFELTIIYFPEMKYNSLFREFLEGVLEGNNLEFKIYQIDSSKEWGKRYIMLLHELYDFKENAWKPI